MASKVDDGRVWGRAEALDTLGRVPGRRWRTFAGVVGVAAIAVGSYLAFNAPPSNPAPPPVAALRTQAAPPTAAPDICTSVAVDLPANRIPAEGILPKSVIRLSRIDTAGSAQLLIPQAVVARAEPLGQGGQRLSILARSGTTFDAEGRDMVDQINGANADGSLVAAILYDVNSDDVVAECRRIG